MIKIVKFIISVCVFVNGFNISKYTFESLNDCCAESEEVVYAKVLKDCVLYKNEEMDDDLINVYFEVPESYFVVVLENVSEKCLKVQYGKFVGFVDSACVEIAKFVPIVKTLDNVTFDIKENVGTKIWQQPSSSSTVLVMLDAGTVGVSYVASVSGQVPNGGKSDIWYYVIYTPSYDSTNVYEGYVYSENTTNLSNIIFNAETNPIEISDEIQENEKLIFISSTIKTIVIAVVVIPIILFFVVILYNLTKKIKKNTQYNKNNINSQFLNIDNFDKNKNIKSIEKYKNLRLVKNKNIEPKFEEFEDEELL